MFTFKLHENFKITPAAPVATLKNKTTTKKQNKQRLRLKSGLTYMSGSEQSEKSEEEEEEE